MKDFIFIIGIILSIILVSGCISEKEQIKTEISEDIAENKIPPSIDAEDNRCSKIPLDAITKITGFSDIEIKEGSGFFASGGSLFCLVVSNETEHTFLDIKISFRDGSRPFSYWESAFNRTKNYKLNYKLDPGIKRIVDIVGLGQKAFLVGHRDKQGQKSIFRHLYALDNGLLLDLEYRKNLDNTKFLLTDDQLKEIASEILATNFSSEKLKMTADEKCNKISRDAITRISGFSGIKVKKGYVFVVPEDRLSCIIVSNETESVNLIINGLFGNSSQLESDFNSIKNEELNFVITRVVDIVGLGQKAFLVEDITNRTQDIYRTLYVLDNEILLELRSIYLKDINNTKFLLTDDQLKEIAREILAGDFSNEKLKIAADERCSEIANDTVTRVRGLSDIKVKKGHKFIRSEHVSCDFILNTKSEGTYVEVDVFFRNSSQLESQFNSAKKDASWWGPIEITGLGQKAFLVEYRYGRTVDYSFLTIYVLDNGVLLELNYRQVLDDPKFWLTEDQLKEIAREILATI